MPAEPFRTRELCWEKLGLRLGMDEAGSGPSVLLLPALSSISTRGEMLPLLRSLASFCHAAAVDWPGFGDRARPRVDWTPDLLSSFLEWIIETVVVRPDAVVAAGHAASYALCECVRRPGRLRRLVLVAPTWRGPLPTMVGANRPWFNGIRRAIDVPVLGPMLFRLNVSAAVLRKMAREHVYDDPNWLSGAQLAAKRAVTRTLGARHASVRFVTGSLDRIASRDDFLDLARRANVPMLVVLGEGTPKKSRAEMECLADLPGVEVARLPSGRLAVHEEFPSEVAQAIEQFLR